MEWNEKEYNRRKLVAAKKYFGKEWKRFEDFEFAYNWHKGMKITKDGAYRTIQTTR